MSQDSRQITIALLGLGTVGEGIYKVLQKQAPLMMQKLNTNIRIAKILVRTPAKHISKVSDPSILTDDYDVILNDPEIRIVVEVMGGIEPAYTYIRKAFEAGKSVVTANKDLIAAHGSELIEIAESNGCELRYEASVAGGIPIINPLLNSLAANEITEITGIVNGTTNFILTKMTREGMDYSQALAEATRLGYAEPDPTNDVEGYDAARKIAIMAQIAFHTKVTLANVYTEGITKVTARDISYDTGKVHKIRAFEIPEATRTAKGTPAVNFLNLMQRERVTTIIPFRDFRDDKYLIAVTKKGTIKKTAISQFDTNRKTGLIAITLRDGDELVGIKQTSGTDNVIIITRNGKCICFSEEDVRPMGRIAGGVRAIRLEDDDEVVSMQLVQPEEQLMVVTGKGYGKRTSVDEYKIQARGGKGLLTYDKAKFKKTGRLIGAEVVTDEDEIILINSKGTVIRIEAKDVSVLGRATQGVKIMRAGEDVEIISMARVINEEEHARDAELAAKAKKAKKKAAAKEEKAKEKEKAAKEDNGSEQTSMVISIYDPDKDE